MKLSRKREAPDERHPIDQMLPTGSLLVYGLQHVMSMYAGVVAVPLVVGEALGLSFTDLATLLTAALLVSGLATLLQTLGVWKIGARLPLVQGASFAAVASMLAIGKGAGGGTYALQVIFGAVLVAGVVGFLLSGVFHRLLDLFPPVVTGSIITVIGISLLPVAVKWAGGGSDVEAPGFASPSSVGLAAFTLVVIIAIYRFLPTFFSRIAILLGLVVGTAAAAVFGMTDFSRIGEARWFAISTPFQFGPPVFDVAAIVSMTIVMLVIMTETTADILAVGEVVGRPANGRTVVNGLRADCLSTAASGGLLNSFSASAFAQNVGMVAITGVKSRFVVATGGLILVVLGLFPKIGAVVASIPQPVLGGAGIVLFATVAASGIRALSRVDYEGNNNLVIVAVSVGVGVIPIAVPTFYEHFPMWFQTVFDSGISSAAITAVLLNLLFTVGRSGRRREAAIFAEGPTVGVTPSHDRPVSTTGSG
ncbi:nucleobase:cation symporter-2 family protein [Actinomycetospora termitidis]|uniref:Nucleobase:cation symporter-2 family protein n=1 Tax=Actinomycetospora termitidis TaxID=3053470 RepID=A0ABT7MG20_9PSEU|nr:nucleobase:cation symporter-2 family protein [Actinomycetospora sp. Odt1-22]MDL5159104.1 nucleobase:cation symporter-2 family protein [Actinomycetospora sp. Odt1-22]